MAPSRIKTLILVLEILIYCKFSHQSDESCDVKQVHLINEDGNEQIFKIRPVLSSPSCNVCAGESQSSSSHLTRQNPSSSQSKLPEKRAVMPGIPLIIRGLGSCEQGAKDMPFGRCPESKLSLESEPMDNDMIMGHAQTIYDQDLVPMSTGDRQVDIDIAFGVVLLNTGKLDETVKHFSKIIKEHPEVVAGYHGRAAAYSRKGIRYANNAARCLEDYDSSINIDGDMVDSYEHRAEILTSLGRNVEAMQDVNAALDLKSSAALYTLRGRINFALEDLAQAENDFRTAAKLNDGSDIASMYHLALTLFYRGKIRNALEVFKDILNEHPEHQETLLGIAQSYKELGNIRKGASMFQKAKEVDAKQPLLWQLMGTFYYHQGDALTALSHFEECLRLSPHHEVCEYMKGLSHLAAGQFYEGLKSHTKVIVYKTTSSAVVSSEYLKAHYLREYARYLHNQLDSNLTDVNVDWDLSEEFRSSWLTLQPNFFTASYREQPGIKPEIDDVQTLDLSVYPDNVALLVCKAHRVGRMTQVDVDGYVPNKRLNMAMGLAAIHIAQLVRAYMNDVKTGQATHVPKWQSLYDTAVRYLRLVDPEQTVFRLDSISENVLNDGHLAYQIDLIRGDVSNIQVSGYFDLVFKLVKTMVQHFTEESGVNMDAFKDDIQNAETCEDLLKITKQSGSDQQEFVVSTQVPSMRDRDSIRLEGLILTLSAQPQGKAFLSISLGTSNGRTSSFHSELDYLFEQFYQEIRKAGSNKSVDIDTVGQLILSMVYYFNNLMPLSRGTSVVAYSVALGLFMAVGKEVTGRIPKGKLLEMEAILSGAPQAFQLVTKTWINIKKSDLPVQSLPDVQESLPTVRSVLEALNLAAATNC